MSPATLQKQRYAWCDELAVMRSDVVAQCGTRGSGRKESMQRGSCRVRRRCDCVFADGCKDTQKARRRPSNLAIIPPDNELFATSPLSSPYNGALLSSTSNLMAIFNDMLRSPASSADTCPRSASLHKALPTRPRSSSAPSTPDLPVELPGSLLQRNQGFPCIETQDFTPSRPTSQNVRRGTHPPDRSLEDEGDILDLLHLFPEPLNHSKSVPALNADYREGAMKSSRAGAASSASTNNRSKPHRVYHRKALSDIEWQTLSDSNSTTKDNAAVPASPPPCSKAADTSFLDLHKLPQPTQVILDTENAYKPAERRASRRNNVSTKCFLDVVSHSPSSSSA